MREIVVLVYSKNNLTYGTKMIRENYSIIRKDIEAPPTQGSVTQLKQYVTEGFPTENKLVFAKLRSDLTGTLWGEKVNEIKKTESILADPIIDDKVERTMDTIFPRGGTDFPLGERSRSAAAAAAISSFSSSFSLIGRRARPTE